MPRHGIGTQSHNAQTLAIDLIRNAILEGRLKPGERLKEPQLAAELSISRTPIREALFTLQADGLIELEPNVGARVRTFGPKDLEQMYDLRVLLEGHAARRATARISELELLQLKASCERFDELRDSSDVLALYHENQNFHGIIVAAAGNDALTEMVRRARLPMVYSSYCWLSADERAEADSFHRRIAKALEARAGERAEWLMKEHLLQARDFLINRLNDEAANGVAVPEGKSGARRSRTADAATAGGARKPRARPAS